MEWLNKALISSQNKIRRAELYLSFASSGVILLMMSTIIISIFLRIVRVSSIGAYELAQLSLIIIVFLGLAYAQKEKKHIRVDLFSKRLPPKLQIIFDTLGTFMMTAFMVVATWRISIRMLESVAMDECSMGGATWFRLWPGWILVTIGATFFLLELVMQFFGNLARFRTKRDKGSELM